MSAVQYLNRNAEVARSSHALSFNVGAAKGLQDLLRSNLGPKGTMKMLVSGAGDIKLTKDGGVLLKEMQIQHPSAMVIARTATAQDDSTGDGTTTCVLMIGELLKQAERYLSEGVHPRVITEGFDIAQRMAVQFLDEFKTRIDTSDRAVLVDCARTALCTKVNPEIVDHMASIVVDAVLCIKQPDRAIDLHMVEIMQMQHRMDSDTMLVKGIVMDHGARHPDMKKYMENCYILTLNVSLEYERSEVNSSFFFSSAAEREKLVEAERSVTDEKVRKIIALKHQVCGDDPNKNFVVINQKGIDPISLDMLAKAGIFALRRAKRRNMERLILACGGFAVSSADDMSESVLGFAGKVHEHTLGDDKFTFVEDVKNPRSCTILIKGPNRHTITLLKDAVRDGLRCAKNTLESDFVVRGGGCFEVACSRHMMQQAETVEGRAKRGVQAFAEALLVVPKALAENCGMDKEDCLIAMQDMHREGTAVGLDGYSGECMDPEATGVYDGYFVKRQLLTASASIASQLLLVDEIMRAGRSTGAPGSAAE